MADRNLVVRFILNLARWRPGSREMLRTTDQIIQKTDQASVSQNKFQSSVNKSGDQAAAAAVRFQTMTQGMLNLTTAGAQTFTSFSNLDRAGNRLAMAQIAVFRATDLLSAKELRLADQRKKDVPNLAKIAQLEQEIATAQADRIVKVDKLKIEEGALMDIQILFATNIANVMISSLQTVQTLRQAQIGLAIKQIFWEKILNKALLQKNVLNATGAPSQMLMNKATSLGTITVRGLTLSVRGLLVALGPIALVIGGIGAAMAAWEFNIFGVRDALGELGGPFRNQKKLTEEVNAQYDESIRLSKEMSGEFGTNLPKSLEELRGAYDLLSEEIQKNNALLGLNKKHIDSVKLSLGNLTNIPTLSNQTGTGGGTPNFLRAGLPAFLGGINLFLRGATTRAGAGQFPVRNLNAFSPGFIGPLPLSQLPIEEQFLFQQQLNELERQAQQRDILIARQEARQDLIKGFKTAEGKKTSVSDETLFRLRSAIIRNELTPTSEIFQSIKSEQVSLLFSGEHIPDPQRIEVESATGNFRIITERNPITLVVQTYSAPLAQKDKPRKTFTAAQLEVARFKTEFNFNFGTNTGSGFNFRPTQFAPLGASSRLGGDPRTIQQNLLLTGRFNQALVDRGVQGLLAVGGSNFLQDPTRLQQRRLGIRPIGTDLFPLAGTTLTRRQTRVLERGLGLGGFTSEAVYDFFNQSRISNASGTGINFANPGFQEGKPSGDGVGPSIEAVMFRKLRDSRANLFARVFGAGRGVTRAGQRRLSPEQRLKQGLARDFTDVLPDDLAALAQVANIKAINAILGPSNAGSGGGAFRRLKGLQKMWGLQMSQFMAAFQIRIDNAFERYSPDLDGLTKGQIRSEILLNNDADVFGDRIRWNSKLAAETTGEV